MKIIIVVLFIGLSGCTMDGGSVAKEDMNKIITCTDTRDGEVFSFNTNTVTNIRYGVGVASSMDIVTEDGRAMTIADGAEQWLKCAKE